MSAEFSSAKISILIATFNRAADLRQTLASFESVAVPPGWDVELLVIDNASTDSTAEVVSTCKLPNMTLRYRHEPIPGKSGALNGALAEIDSEIVLLTDDDVRVPENWVVEMASPLLANEADAVAGSISIAPHLLRGWMTLAHRKSMAEFVPAAGLAQDMVGANMGFKTNVATKIGGFALELGGGSLGNGEDSLFYWQAKQAGFRVLGLPKVIVEHHFQASRLKRENWIKGAACRGRSQAVMNYRWLKHSGCSPVWKVWQYWVCVQCWRALNATALFNTPCHGLELRHIQKYHYHSHTRSLFLGSRAQ